MLPVVKTDLHKGGKVWGSVGVGDGQRVKSPETHSKVKCFTMFSNLPTAPGKRKKAEREAPPPELRRGEGALRSRVIMVINNLYFLPCTVGSCSSR